MKTPPFSGYVDQADAEGAIEVLEKFARKLREGEPHNADLSYLNEAALDYQLARQGF